MSQDDTTKRRELFETAQAFRNHEEARRHEIKEQARKSRYEYMLQFMTLQRRVWGEDNPDVRESRKAHTMFRPSY